MSDTTPRLALPLLAAGQAQKEVFHNEALVRLDAVAAGTVEGVGIDMPPADPPPGRCWIVGAAPSGAWTGQAHALAIATEGGWRFVSPHASMTVRRADNSLDVRFDGSVWRTGDVVASQVTIGGVKVLGSRQPTIAGPTGGAVIDGEARAAITALIAALSTHGLTDA